MKIFVDGRQVFTTGPTSSLDGVVRMPVVLPLSDANTLTLVVQSLGDRGGDHANWAEVYLVSAASD